MPKVKDDNHFIIDRIPQSRLAGLTLHFSSLQTSLRQHYPENRTEVLLYRALMNVKEIFLKSIRNAVDQPLYNAVVKKNPFSGEPAATLGCGDHFFSRQGYNRVMEHFSKIDREHMVKFWDVDTGSRSQSEINSHYISYGQRIPAL